MCSLAGKASFIRLLPSAKIMAHTGPHHMRLTAHLGLRVPEGAYIEVAGQRRGWAEGKVRKHT